MRRLVLAGAGHAHARVLLDLAKTAQQEGATPRRDIDVVLVSPAALAPYSGMVPGWMAGHYSWEECCIDFGRLCRRAGARMVLDSATGIDHAHSALTLSSGERLSYDVLSLDIGSTATPPTSASTLLPMRPLSRLKEHWERLRQRVCTLPAGARYKVLMIGGGAAAVETILSTRHQLAQWAPQVRFEYTLATQGDALLPTLAPGAGRRIAAHLARWGMRVVYGFTAERIVNGAVTSANGDTLDADTVLWATGAKAHQWPGDGGLAQDSAGFIRVDDTLRSVSHPNIFAAGDCASLPEPVPKAGVFAVRMGPVLSHNLRAALEGRAMQPFVPQRRYLVLLGTGGAHAVAAWGPFSWQGRWVWRWKRRIDLRFLRQYNGVSHTSY